MKQKLFIFLGLIFLIVLLIGLNAASYVQKEKVPDNEINPNRSTFNAGATGTRAFYDLLAETGHKVTRWQEPLSSLSVNNKDAPSTFVIIGQTRREFTEDEATQLLRWVSEGGKLVIIDREPAPSLLATTTNWGVTAVPESEPPFFNTDPSDQSQMTANTKAANPVQPSVFTKSISAVQPSRFASTIDFERFPKNSAQGDNKIPATPPFSSATPPGDESDSSDYMEQPVNTQPDNTAEDSEIYDTEPPPQSSNRGTGQGSGIGSVQPPPPPAVIEADETPTEEPIQQLAPVAHLRNDEKILLADFPFGSGQIVYLTDPYIVSNAGVKLVDNAQLGINIVASRAGTIAFDEYHQGYGANENRLLQYFAETPVVAIFLQICVLIALILYSQSRRFARPLPADEPDRLSKLEYVAAMAELQRRTRGFDLALENIYGEFRRRVSQFVGVHHQAVSRRDLAQVIAERLNLPEIEIYNLLGKCENIAHGEPTNKREVLKLVSRLREIEEKLGLKRDKRGKVKI